MTVLNFTLNEEGIAVLHDALTCMFKFSDELCLEAKREKVLSRWKDPNEMIPELTRLSS